MMNSVLVDSNVILDIVTDDPRWGTWSSNALARYADQAELLINPIIYAEVSVGFASIEELEEVLHPQFFRREALAWEAGFLAGKCFLKYRRSKGERRSPLPDFYIGSHAAIRQYRLLTRDVRRFKSYFPTVELLTPETEPATAGIDDE